MIEMLHKEDLNTLHGAGDYSGFRGRHGCQSTFADQLIQVGGVFQILPLLMSIDTAVLQQRKENGLNRGVVGQTDNGTAAVLPLKKLIVELGVRPQKMDPNRMPASCFGICIVMLLFPAVQPKGVSRRHKIPLSLVFQNAAAADGIFDEVRSKAFPGGKVVRTAYKIPRFLQIQQESFGRGGNGNGVPGRTVAQIQIVFQ